MSQREEFPRLSDTDNRVQIALTDWNPAKKYCQVTLTRDYFSSNHYRWGENKQPHPEERTRITIVVELRPEETRGRFTRTLKNPEGFLNAAENPLRSHYKRHLEPEMLKALEQSHERNAGNPDSQILSEDLQRWFLSDTPGEGNEAQSATRIIIGDKSYWLKVVAISGQMTPQD